MIIKKMILATMALVVVATITYGSSWYLESPADKYETNPDPCSPDDTSCTKQHYTKMNCFSGEASCTPTEWEKEGELLYGKCTHFLLVKWCSV